MRAKWKVNKVNLLSVGTGDSVEVVGFEFNVSDSYGGGNRLVLDEIVYFVPKYSNTYADSSEVRAILQSDAFDNWLEVDSDHTHYMERVEWGLKTRLLQHFHDGYEDSYTTIKTIRLTDSAEVVNPLGL